MRLECAKVIAELRQKYDLNGLTYSNLGHWIFSCISNSLNAAEIKSKVKIRYLNCIIEYHPQKLFFNLYKNPETNIPTAKDVGCTYDVSIFAGVHFLELFGEGNVKKLQQAVWLSDADITDVSNSIREEIHDWCSNIEEIFDIVFNTH